MYCIVVIGIIVILAKVESMQLKEYKVVLNTK